MPNTPGYTDYILEQLERVGPITSRRMFGALGIYSDALFFAIVDNDTLFFKVDDTTRGAYLDAGMPPFMYSAEGIAMGYYQVPADVLEDDRRLAEWMRRSLEVARAAPPKKRRR
jgi:DNA transformation protein and related proteins